MLGHDREVKLSTQIFSLVQGVLSLWLLGVNPHLIGCAGRASLNVCHLVDHTVKSLGTFWVEIIFSLQMRSARSTQVHKGGKVFMNFQV